MTAFLTNLTKTVSEKLKSRHRFHFCSIVPGVKRFKLLSNCYLMTNNSVLEMTTNTWNESEAESVQVTITKTMTKITNLMAAPVVGVLGNCDEETWTMNWNKLGIDSFSLYCSLTIHHVGIFSLSFHNSCLTLNAQRMKFQKKLFPWVASCGHVGKKCTS